MVGWLGGFMLVCGLGGLGVLLLAVGFPCPLGLVGVRPLCVGGFPGAGGGLFLVGLRWCVKVGVTQGAGIGFRTLGGFVCLCFSSLACPSGACWGFLGLRGA